MNSEKKCDAGRLLHGHAHEFVRMKRTGAIPIATFDAASFPAHFVLTLHIGQGRMTPIQSLYRQAISNALTYTGMR